MVLVSALTQGADKNIRKFNPIFCKGKIMYFLIHLRFKVACSNVGHKSWNLIRNALQLTYERFSYSKTITHSRVSHFTTVYSSLLQTSRVTEL